jgi:hypothetical protein
MNMHAGRVAGLVLVFLLVTSGSVGAIGQGPAEQLDIDADAVTLDVALQPDGDAIWEIRYRIRLEDANATEAFEQLQRDIEANPETYVTPVRERMNRTVNSAENATGREMDLEEVSISTTRRSQPQTEYGIVTYRFAWRNFAQVDAETIRAGDAIDQMILDSSTTLRFAWPDSYELDATTPDATRSGETEVIWQGQRSFDPGEPRVVLIADGGPTVTTTTPTQGSPDGPAAGGGGFPVVPVAALAVLVIAGAAWLYTRRTGRGGGVSGGSADRENGGDDGHEGGSEVTATGSEGPPPELMSNEERVLGLLEDNGGRMKQKEVADELDWSAARTSQVVSDLREEGKLDSFRLGRENVLTLPDVAIDVGPEEDQSDE